MRGPGAADFCTKHATWLAPGNVRRAWRDVRTELGDELDRAENGDTDMAVEILEQPGLNRI